MSNLERNKSILEQGFSMLRKNSQRMFLNGLEELLEFGVKTCLDSHEGSHTRHLESGNSYAWFILYDGVEIKRKLFIQGMNEGIGNASQALERQISNLSGTKGYVGVVLAGMKKKDSDDPNGYTYFSWRAEARYIRMGIRALKSQDFQMVFKPI